MLDGAQTSPILHKQRQSGGNIHLLRGKQGNNLLGLDSDGKRIRKYVFAQKAVLCTEDMIFKFSIGFSIPAIFYIHKHTHMHTYLLFE